MLVDVGKENYSDIDYVCKLNVIFLKKMKLKW